jgi:hypothetical protein
MSEEVGTLVEKEVRRLVKKRGREVLIGIPKKV